jgi:hypothetical protein
MKRLHIDRIELHLKGVDARTAEAAARLLGPALAARLARSGAQQPEDAAQGLRRLGSQPDAEQLSRAVAERVSGEVRAHLARPQASRKSAD